MEPEATVRRYEHAIVISADREVSDERRFVLQQDTGKKESNEYDNDWIRAPKDFKTLNICHLENPGVAERSISWLFPKRQF